MTDHVRELAHSIVISVMIVLAILVLIAGTLLQWSVEVSAEVASSFAVGASIVILVMEKIFQRPHFSVLKEQRIMSPLLDDKRKKLVLLIQNDGRMDANLVRARAIAAGSLFSRFQRYDPSLSLSLTSIQAKEHPAIPIKVGEEFEVFIPVSLLTVSEARAIKGRLLLIIHTAFSNQFFLFSYHLEEQKLKVKRVNPILSFFLETPIIARHRKNKKQGDSWLEI